MRVITIDDLYRYSSPIREWDDRRIINICNVEYDVSFDIVQCKECKFAYRGPDGKSGDPNDIVCTYWESDGLEADDFCSQGEYGEYKWDPNCIDDLDKEHLKEG
jgi:hypothetical protein